MRKALKLTIMGLIAFMAGSLSANAQICVPDGQYTAPGLYPDTVTGFAPAFECVYYEQVLTMIVPTDTLTCTIDSVQLTALTGLPPGLTYGCNPVSCGFPGGTSGCGLIFGIPTDTGTYALTASSITYLSGPPFCVASSPLNQNMVGYTITVNSPISFSTTAPMCVNDCNGSVTALHPALTPPITYQWNDLATQTTNPATGLCAGNYTVTITDSAGCVSAKSIELIDPAAVVATISGFANVTCNGSSDGSATASGSGGTGTFTYMWSNGDSIATTATPLDTGTYMVTVTDANGCVDSTNVVITEPPMLALVTGSVAATCGNQDGSASVAVTGGTLSYTYLWYDPASQTTDTAFGLGSDSYMVLVTDGNGCQDSVNVSVSDLGAPTISLQSSSGVTCNSDCNGDATVSATGGATPYTFTWNTNPVQTGTTATGLCGGTVDATVTDGLGCNAILSVSISEPSAVLISNESGTGITCFGLSDGIIDITAAGGTGSLTYSIDGGSNYTGSGSFIGLAGGNYNIVVMDDSGCTDTGSAMTLSTPTAVLTVNTSSSIESVPGAGDGSAVANPTGGTPAYTYAWSTSPTQTTQTANGLTTGSYQVVVTDANGCSVSDSIDVGVGVGIAEMISAIEVKLYPNPAKDRITVEINYNESAVIEIIDLIGKQLLSEVMNNKITIDINSFKEGLYLYRISTRDGMKIHQGKMSIVR